MLYNVTQTRNTSVLNVTWSAQPPTYPLSSSYMYQSSSFPDLPTNDPTEPLSLPIYLPTNQITGYLDLVAYLSTYHATHLPSSILTYLASHVPTVPYRSNLTEKSTQTCSWSVPLVFLWRSPDTCLSGT